MNSNLQRGHYAVPQMFHNAPNAALLIDFDNVTLAIQKDLGKELKTLLNSEVIRGKVAVQRAYADWRRYPQYVVNLAESSVDLIFAPAYGTSKKNATDLRMAIDAIELVFTRPEIGTFILLTGDSDFSSCVLKLKEYGKYVIGVGMRESSSDLLIQNCDEYYSYHALSGLTRTGENEGVREDPWELVERAAQRMVENNDAMRSDRLKQVMMEMDPGFDEKKLGYSKFSRFVSEAATKGLLRVRRGENGQQEISVDGAAEAGSTGTAEPTRERRGRNGRGRSRAEPTRPAPSPIETTEPAEEVTPTEPEPQVAAPAEAVEPAVQPAPTELQEAYGLLQQAIRLMDGRGGQRDGDVKRKMLDLSPEFDESSVGFGKFSRFLRQAHEDEAVDLARQADGSYEVSLPSNGKRYAAPSTPRQWSSSRSETAAATVAPVAAEVTGAEPVEVQVASAERVATEPAPGTAETPAPGAGRVGVRGRRSSRARAGTPDAPPPLLPGQVVGIPAAAAEERGGETPAPEPRKRAARPRTRKPAATPTAPEAPAFSAAGLGLPTDTGAIERYVTNRYKGFGIKTAEALTGAFGADLFQVLQEQPERVRAQLGRRADALLEQWEADYARRAEAAPEPEVAAEEPSAEEASAETPPRPRRRGGRGGRSRKPKAPATA